MLEILPHTGRIDGDDAGYRNVRGSAMDVVNPDLLMPIEGVETLPIYAVGAIPGICPYYGTGIGGSETILVRKPVLLSLLDVNHNLRPYGRECLVLDGHRSPEVQRNLWVDVWKRVTDVSNPQGMSVLEFLKKGMEADDIGAYAPVVRDEKFEAAVNSLLAGYDVHYERAAEELKLDSAEAAAALWLTFQTNLGLTEFQLDQAGNTAHGSGGATDVYLLDTETNKPTNLGVPFDCIGEPSRMDWFEDDNNFDAYVSFVSERNDVKEYLKYFNIWIVTHADFVAIREERRILYHAMVEAGASFYVGEPWHFNHGNERGGNQAIAFPGGGNSCHSLLKNVVDGEGNYVAVWTNDVANRLAREFVATA